MFDAKSVAMDFGLMSILLFAAHLARSRIRVLQNCFIPTSILAGFLGLFGGYQFLDLLPFSPDGIGQAKGTSCPYPGLLIVLLFATLFLGKREQKAPSLRAIVRDVGDTFFYNLASYVGMFGLSLLFGLTVLRALFPDLHPGFAMMLPAGFVGGHGTAGAMGGVLIDEGWQEARDVGYTFATVGVLVAIGGGIVLVNLATRRGWTRLVRSPGEIPEGIRSGFTPPDQAESMGRQTVSPVAMDPLTWHVALAFVALAAAYYVKDALPDKIGAKTPAFCVAMLAGALLQLALDAARLGQYVDRHVMVRVGSTVADYLIAFAVASLKVSVIETYAAPLAVTSIFGLAFAVGLMWFVGRRLFRNFWAERSIFTYGWNTGIVGIGVTLLRIVDPSLRSKTLQDFSLAYVPFVFAEIAIIVFLPVLVTSGYFWTPALVLTAAFLACILLSARVVGWFSGDPATPRDGETAIVRNDES